MVMGQVESAWNDLARRCRSWPTVINFRGGTARTCSSTISGVGTSTRRPSIALIHLSGTSTTLGSPATGFSRFWRQLLRVLVILWPFLTR